jgi:histidine triad (HIT) family protein
MCLTLSEGKVSDLNCVFCDIVEGSTASYIIYQDERFVAVLDKYPISIGHSLMMPKKHYTRVEEMSQEEFAAMYVRVHQLNHIITSRLGAQGSHISINDGAAANQLIPHVHVHIIPRSENDNAGFTARKLLRPNEMDEIRRKLEVKELQLVF